MKLPRSEHPLFDIELPSTKHKIKVKPMTVKSEKILLMAKESDNPSDIFQAIKQVVQNCLVYETSDVNTFTLFDLEYVFLQIRSISVSNVVSVTYVDKEDNKDYTFEIDLNRAKIEFPKKENDLLIKISEDEGFKMRFPTATIYDTPVFRQKDAKRSDLIDELIIASIESYFKGEHVYKFKDNTKEDIKAFLDDLDINTFNKIRDFVAELPHLHYEIKYKNTLGNEHKIVLSTLSDFFTLR